MDSLKKFFEVPLGGKILTTQGKTIQTFQGFEDDYWEDHCAKCCLEYGGENCIMFYCDGTERKDKNHIYFMEVEYE